MEGRQTDDHWHLNWCPRRSPEPDLTHRAIFTGGLVATAFITAALLVTLSGGARYGWSSGPILGLVAIALAGLLACLFVEHRAARTDHAAVSVPQFGLLDLLGVVLLSTVVLFAAMLYVPLFMQDVHHYSAST